MCEYSYSKLGVEKTQISCASLQEYQNFILKKAIYKNYKNTFQYFDPV